MLQAVSQSISQSVSQSVTQSVCRQSVVSLSVAVLLLCVWNVFTPCGRSVNDMTFPRFRASAQFLSVLVSVVCGLWSVVCRSDDLSLFVRLCCRAAVYLWLFVDLLSIVRCRTVLY